MHANQKCSNFLKQKSLLNCTCLQYLLVQNKFLSLTSSIGTPPPPLPPLTQLLHVHSFLLCAAWKSFLVVWKSDRSWVLGGGATRNKADYMMYSQILYMWCMASSKRTRFITALISL